MTDAVPVEQLITGECDGLDFRPFGAYTSHIAPHGAEHEQLS